MWVIQDNGILSLKRRAVIRVLLCFRSDNNIGLDIGLCYEKPTE